ncbi:unnamed protein product [Periconia digitata]|uniref:Uncharacterized protein n=1 Tax=Periconia digitata TaxID=1303443 RepID=A0A9W4XID9_9PLEO|nr:unnamed protein product [Periconia digitata]
MNRFNHMSIRPLFPSLPRLSESAECRERPPEHRPRTNRLCTPSLPLPMPHTILFLFLALFIYKKATCI